MIGSVWATIYIVNLPEIGGMNTLLSQSSVATKLDILPDFSNTESLITLFIIPFAVQWWSTWYPGAEPGGGGYIAQRMLAAKDEKNVRRISKREPKADPADFQVNLRTKQFQFSFQF